MKHKTFISLIVLLLLASISFIGCNDNGGGGSSHQTLTENDFVDNPSLQADPDNQIIVDFEESPDSDTPQYDTGPVGMDDIPLTYPYTETVTFCWTDDNTADMDYMVLLDSQGKAVLRVDDNGDCVTDMIEPGDYVMELHHDNSTDPHTIFMGPDTNQNQQAMKSDGLFNGYKVVATKILKGICNTITHDAGAQTTMCNNRVNYVLQVGRCRDCNLKDANFRGQYMYNIDLRQADMRNDNLRQAYLDTSNLDGVNLDGANLKGARFFNVNFTRAYIPKYVANYALGDCASFGSSRWCNNTCKCDFISLCSCTGCGSIARACNYPTASCAFGNTFPLTAHSGCVGPPDYLAGMHRHCQ